MFWLFWQLVGVVLGILAILLILGGIVLGFKAVCYILSEYRETILWTLAILMMSAGALLDGELRQTLGFWGAALLLVALIVTVKRHRKNGTVPFRCKCGAWVHIGKCPKYGLKGKEQ